MIGPFFDTNMARIPWTIQESSINQKFNYTISVMLCTGATYVKKNSCLVARIVSFNAAGLQILTFRILEPFRSKDIELDLSQAILH